MNSVFNTHLVFDGEYSGNYVIPGGYRYYFSWDAVILYGAGVNFSDQQHNNNRGPNYFSYYVKNVRLRGDNRYRFINGSPGDDYKLTVVLYKCPAKYENGNLVPIHTKGFVNLEHYILYSDPECVLAWGVYTNHYQTDTTGYFKFDFSLSCNKPFILGPNDLICCNLFVDTSRSGSFVDNRTSNNSVDAKVVFDIN